MAEIDSELVNYDKTIVSIESNIKTTERKKARILNILNSNRLRHESICKDIKKYFDTSSAISLAPICIMEAY